MKRAAGMLIVLVVAALAVLGLLVVARQDAAATATPELTFDGRLTTAEFMPIDDTCDLRFQLFDAAFEGHAAGDAVEAIGVQVRAGVVGFPAPAAQLDQEQPAPRWLAIAVRCSGDNTYVPLAPRLKHHAGAPAAVDEVQAKLDALAAQGLLVCGDPADAAMVNQDVAPTVWGTEYRLQGGFRRGLAVAPISKLSAQAVLQLD